MGVARSAILAVVFATGISQAGACEPLSMASTARAQEPLGEVRACLPSDPTSPDEIKDLAAAVDELMSPGAFRDYFSDLISASGVSLCVDPGAIQCRGYFEPEPNVIAVAAGLTRADKTLIIAHELRHLDQKRRGFGLSLDVDMDEHVRLTYAMEADAQAFVTMFAWSARTSGHPELWKAILRLEHYEDIPEAFAAAMKGDATTTEAMRAAFAAWFTSSWRLEQYYLSAGGNYLDQLDERHAIRRFDPLPSDAFNRLCLMPDGSEYGCQTVDALHEPPAGPPAN